MEISNARKLKALEDETAKLKKLLARRRPWRGAELTGNILARGEFIDSRSYTPCPRGYPLSNSPRPARGFFLAVALDDFDGVVSLGVIVHFIAGEMMWVGPISSAKGCIYNRGLPHSALDLA